MIVSRQNVSVEVTNVLRVDGNTLGQDLTKVIFDDLTIPNLAHIKAKERNLWQWEKIPANHTPFSLDGDELVLPRGYALRLKQLLREHNLKVRWIDRTQWQRGEPLGREEFSFRDHQPAALAAIKRHRQGIYKAPTGSGKTAAICSVIWDMCPQRTLIIVDKQNLITQWERDIAKHLSIDKIGHIGGGEWTEERITVATIQTLWSRRYDVDDDWWKQWDLVDLDECHHVTARTLQNIMARFWARLLLGTSATPDKTGEFELAKAVLGPVFHENTHAELRDGGFLVKPNVKVVYSDFQFTYWGDHQADKHGKCEVPYCIRKHPYHNHRNNYQQLLQALVEDAARNDLIAHIAKTNADHTVLICTDRIKHIEAIYHALQADAATNLAILTGQQSGEERDNIIHNVAHQGHGIILSTIANEALNIPSIDRIILGFPTRNAKKTEQQVGRGTRATAGKTDCLVYDIADDVGPLIQQLRSRVTGCYQPLELEVQTLNKPTQRKGLGRLHAA